MKKILKSIFAFVLVIPFVVLLTACGGAKNLDGKTYVFNRVEVTGTINKTDIENEYIYMSFEFKDGVLNYVNGTETDSFDYKLEDGKVYTKSSSSDEYSSSYFAEISGKYLIVTETSDDGIAKIYFKKK